VSEHSITSYAQVETKRVLRGLLLLSNALVYGTLALYYFVVAYSNHHTIDRSFESFDRTAQLCVAFAALVTAGAFMVYIVALLSLYMQVCISMRTSTFETLSHIACVALIHVCELVVV
jgi:uncharacterized protein YqhQ